MAKSDAGHRHKTWCKFQRLDKIPVEFDETPAQWVTVYTLPAAYRPEQLTMRVGEDAAADRLEAINRALFVIRWQPDISAEWRIVIDDAKFPEKPVYHITHARDLNGDRRYLHLTAVRTTVPDPPRVVLSWAWHDAGHAWADGSSAIWFPEVSP